MKNMRRWLLHGLFFSLVFSTLVDAGNSLPIKQGMTWVYADSAYPPIATEYALLRRVHVDSLKEKNDSMIINTSETFTGTYGLYDSGITIKETVWHQSYLSVDNKISNLDSNRLWVKDPTSMVLSGMLPEIFQQIFIAVPYNLNNLATNDSFSRSVNNTAYIVHRRHATICPTKYDFYFSNEMGLIRSYTFLFNDYSSIYSKTLLFYCDSTINSMLIVRQLDSLGLISVKRKDLTPKTISRNPLQSSYFDFLGRRMPASLLKERTPIPVIELINGHARKTGFVGRIK
jgi:hypothetical protein